MQEIIWNSSNIQDQTLISQSQQGDHIAFESLVRKYQHQLSALLRHHAGPAADTDELLQILMCKVYFSLQSFDANRPFYPWLHRIALNLCCDEKRRLRRKMRKFVEFEPENFGKEAEQLTQIINSYSDMCRQEMKDALGKVIGMLPRKYQEIITLRHLQQIPYEEIGVILKCTPRAARIKAFRARTALRKLLQGSFSAEAGYSVLPGVLKRRTPAECEIQ